MNPTVGFEQFVPAAAMPLVPFIVLATLGLVNFVKSFGVQGRVLMLVSFLIGCAYYAVLVLVPINIVSLIAGMSLFGLSACGIYDFAKILGNALDTLRTPKP